MSTHKSGVAHTQLAMPAARAVVVVAVATVATLFPFVAVAARPVASLAIPRPLFIAGFVTSENTILNYNIINNLYKIAIKFINVDVYLDSPADRLSRDLRRPAERLRGDLDRERDLRPLGDDSRSLFRLKSSNLRDKRLFNIVNFTEIYLHIFLNVNILIYF